MARRTAAPPTPPPAEPTKRDRLFARSKPTATTSTAAATTSQMAMVRPARTLKVSSAALRRVGDDPRMTRQRRRALALVDRTWQEDAYAYTCGSTPVSEVGALVNVQADTVALCGFPVRRRTPDGDWVANEPNPDDEGKTDPEFDPRPDSVMEAFVGPYGGFAELIRRAAYNVFIGGEATLLGTAEGSNGILWEFLSVRELYPNADGAYVRRRAGIATLEEALPPDNFTARLWKSSAEFSDLADSEVKRVIPILAQVVKLQIMIDAIIESQMPANMIFIPEELSFPTPAADEQGDAVDAEADTGEYSPTPDDGAFDEFMEELFAHMTSPGFDPRSAARLMPLIIQGKGEFGQYIQVIELSRKLDSFHQDLLKDALGRLGTSLDAPPEIISGKGNANHWTSANIDQEFIVKHIQPIGNLIAEFLTDAYLRAMLKAYENMSDDEVANFKIEFDPSPVIARADEAKSARDLSDWLSDEALLLANGFTKADMASPEEVRVRRLWWLISNQPAQFARLLPMLPGFEDVDPELIGAAPPPAAPPADELDPNDPNTPPPPPGQEADGPEIVDAESGQETPDRPTGLSILVERLAAAADQSMKRAIERAGSLVASAAQGEPQLRDRLRAVRKDRVMSLVTEADLRQFRLTRKKLLAGAWDDLAVDARGWIQEFLEQMGIEALDANERAAVAASQLCATLDQTATDNLLNQLKVGENGLRIPHSTVTAAVEPVVFATA